LKFEKFSGREGMRGTSWRRLAAIVLLLGLYIGCTMPSSPQNSGLTPATAQNTLDSWNPSFCKVAEFYGSYRSGGDGTKEVAYVSIINPSDKNQKPIVHTAQFQLLTLPGGKQQWFLVSLVTHSSGLSRRQGWDNLVIPVKEPAAAK
jgi:hypothetical protein